MISCRAGRVLLVAVGSLVISQASRAADLPARKAAPVEYLRICSLGGGEFVGYVIPGTDVCLKVGGFLRWQYSYAPPFGSNAYLPAPSAWAGAYSRRGYTQQTSGQSAMAALKLDARLDTDYGLVRAFTEWRLDQGFLAGGSTLYKGWIEVGGFQAGRYQSYFDLYADEFNNIGVVGSDNRPVGAAYTAAFGKFSAAVSLEDNSGAIGFPNYYGIQTPVGAGALASYAYPSPFVANPAVSATPYYNAGGYRVPDVVTRLAYADSWGQVQLNGALHQVRASIYDEAIGTTAAGGIGIIPGTFSDHTAYGWAVKASAKLNLPMLGPGDTLYAEAAYTQGAMLYIGATGAYGLGRTLELTYAADALPIGPGGSLKLTDGWNALIAYSHTWTPTISTAFWVGYTAVNYPSGSITGTTGYYAPGVGLQGRDFDYWQLGAQANWTPVTNLTVSGTVNWIDLQAKRLAADPLVYPGGAFTRTSNAAAFALRVERSF